MPRARDAAAAGRVAEARDLLAQAVAAAPGNARAWILFADQQRRLGDAAGALASLDRAYAVGTPEERFDANISGGLVLISLGRPDDAAERFARARELSPRNPVAYAFEAKARFDAGDRRRAADLLRAGLAFAPDDPGLRQAAAAIQR